MAGKRRWEKKPYKVLGLKIFEDDLEKFRTIIYARGRNIQSNFDLHVKKTIE